MTGFYASIIFLGIVIVIVALAAIIFDKKRASDDKVKVDEKKSELVEIINDADQVLSELNNFSEYLVEQVDKKNNELNKSIEKAEEKLKEIHSGYMELVSASSLNVKKAVNGNVQTQFVKKDKQQNTKEDKVIPINNKYTRVMELHQDGIPKEDIAKLMNMGIGEVELTLGTRSLCPPLKTAKNSLDSQLS